jgi:hypothetical protein
VHGDPETRQGLDWNAVDWRSHWLEDLLKLLVNETAIRTKVDLPLRKLVAAEFVARTVDPQGCATEGMKRPSLDFDLIQQGAVGVGNADPGIEPVALATPGRTRERQTLGVPPGIGQVTKEKCQAEFFASYGLYAVRVGASAFVFVEERQ